MQSNLAQIFRIRKFLDDLKYPDSQRIAGEISMYINRNKRAKEEKIFKKLHKNEPWEYIQGYCEFCTSDFKVTKDTLIPRIETEQLVYDCIKIIKKNKIKNIIDVGTGSGCIAISIAKLLSSKPSIYATDISKRALKIAIENEQNILKKKSITWIHTDLIKDVVLTNKPTLAIANLPYIPTSMYEKLDKSVLEHEPKIALDGGKSGLESYERLFKQIKAKRLKVDYLYLETEETIFNQHKQLAKKYFPDKKITGRKDIFNRNRFILIS